MAGPPQRTDRKGSDQLVVAYASVESGEGSLGIEFEVVPCHR
jgi:hypothetical protein